MADRIIHRERHFEIEVEGEAEELATFSSAILERLLELPVVKQAIEAGASKVVEQHVLRHLGGKR
jgi:hypothetical protein